MNSKRFVALIATMAALMGCAEQGPAEKISILMPRGEKATIYAHNQSVPDWMLDRSKLKYNYLVRGEAATEEQLQAIARVEGACLIYTDTVRPHTLVNVIINGVVYGVAGALGVGLGAHVAFSAAATAGSNYYAYGGIAGGASGAANGLISSGGATYTFENCGQQVLGLFPQYDIKIMNKSPF